MLYFLENESLKILINSLGAEVKSVFGKKNNFEYIYQGNPELWRGGTYHVFPICGRLYEGKYTYKGKEYQMGIHGFSRDLEHTLVKKTDKELVFTLKPSKETLEIYPFDFTLTTNFILNENTLLTRYTIFNPSKETLRFSIGGHPGFNIPLEKGIKDEEHYLEFDNVASPKAYEFSPSAFRTGKMKDYPLKDGRIINFSHEIFGDGGIFLTHMDSSVSLKAKNSNRFVKISYTNASVLGFWHTPNTNAPFICIEPWQGIPSLDGKIDDFENKEKFVHLDENKSFTLEYSIEVNE